MSDMELLELAAKAAGIDIRFMALSGANIMTGQSAGKTWNPLTDDGDALHLLVSLRLSLLRYALHVMVADPQRVAVSENYMADPHVATRRAIVRAAAEIGKSLP